MLCFKNMNTYLCTLKNDKVLASYQVHKKSLRVNCSFQQ